MYMLYIYTHTREIHTQTYKGGGSCIKLTKLSVHAGFSCITLKIVYKIKFPLWFWCFLWLFFGNKGDASLQFSY